MQSHNYKFYLFPVLFLLVLLAVPSVSYALTYYVSPTGSNTAPYDTWAKAANLPQTIFGLNPTGPHTVYIGAGSYDGYIYANLSNWANGTAFGVSAAGVAANAVGAANLNYPASPGEVVISNAAHYPLYTAVAGFNVSHMDFTGTDSSHHTFENDGNGTIGRYLRFRNSGSRLMNLVGTGLDLMYFTAEGSDGGVGIYASAASSGTLSYGIFRNSTTKYLGSTYGLDFNSSGNFTLNNVLVMGSPSSTIRQEGSGATTFENSMIFGGNSGYVVSRSAGTITLDHSYLVPNKWNTGPMFSGTVTSTNNITNAYPSFVRRARSAFVVPAVDDGDVSYASQVAAELKARGLKGTYYIFERTLEIPDSLTAIRAIIADGTMEIGVHSWTHSDLSLTGTVFSITKTGATINIDRANNQIVVTPGGTVSGFKTKTLAAIQTELQGFGATVGGLQTNQQSYAFGEIMADSGGAQASPYSAQYLIDTTCNTGLFKSEIKDAKAAIESTLGITTYSFATPYGHSNANLNTAIINCGFTSNRNAYGDASNPGSLLGQIDLGNLAYDSAFIGVSDDDTVKTYARAVGESDATFGSFHAILAHTAAELTIARWALMLDELIKYPEITVTDMHDAVNTIKTGGAWTTLDSRNYSRTWTDQSNYHLLASSPVIDVGTNVSLTTDYAGVSVPKGLAPDMGIYEFVQTTPPTVSITSPTAGTLSGSVSLTSTAGATSPSTVSSVQYYLDDLVLSSIILSSPYSYTWDTTQVPDGNHTLLSVALDNYGNYATSTPVAVTVRNTVTAPTEDPTPIKRTPSGHRQNIDNLLVVGIAPAITVQQTSANIAALQAQMKELINILNQLITQLRLSIK